MPLVIREADLGSEAVQALVALHIRGMLGSSPPEHCFALDASGLQEPGIMVWSAWRDHALVGIGALKDHGDGVGEVKSMRTDPAHLRQGVAGLMLEHIIRVAKARGLSRLSLETGCGPLFEPALALYRGRGFREGPPFADYVASPFNRFLHLDL